MTTDIAQAVQMLRWKSRERTPEEKSLEVTSENRHRGCSRNMLRQTVPSRGSSNGEGPIADGGQLYMMDSQWQWGRSAV